MRQRLIEFMGGETLDQATAVYLTHSDGCLFDRAELRPTRDLDWFLERSMDIARSLADTRSYLLHLDIEYVNFDAPAAAYMDPWRCFDLQEPAVKVIESLLLEFGIRPLHLVTGQGHHFIWRITQDSEVARRICALDPAPELAPLCLRRLPPMLAGAITAKDQTAFAAIALLTEFLASRIKELAAPRCEIPVEVTAVHVGPCATRRREMISIDISEYGDPLHTRMTRMPFTHYRKPWVTGLVRHLGIEDQIPAFRAIPLHEIDVRQALIVRQVEAEVFDLARRACVRIPCQESGTTRLLEAYLDSPLRRFHEAYYAARHDPRECWQDTYARTDLAKIPACARHLLVFPNDLLLKPAGIQLVTRSLLALDWHPRHIAGLIRSKFEDPAFGWGVNWGDYEPATRADFYTRLFAGLHLSGVDRLVDFNCTSTQEKGFCFPDPGGDCSLETSRATLLSRLPP
jgi:hypothetical protein